LTDQRWLIRVASHRRHGGGHVARCATLASALAGAGAEVVVQLDPDSPEAAARLAQQGVACSEDAPSGSRNGVVLDGYELMAQEAAKLARLAPLVVIDDFLDPPAEAALAVNGALHLDGEWIGDTPALLGPRYALVDPRFAALPARDRTAPVRAILVTMGRLDPENFTSRSLDLLAANAGEAAVTVVASAETAQRDGLGERLQSPHRLVIDAPDIAPLLAETDFVVGAGGVSLMERMAAGVPSLTLRLAENQRLFIAGAARLGATIDGGTPDAACAAALRDILADGATRAAMATAGRRAVDGRGAARVAERLVELAGQGGDRERNAMQGIEA
jgi:UDP-2,4-diacetamido-2,4,6-trideoxy-beta-L-altropyranose hydrolase